MCILGNLSFDFSIAKTKEILTKVLKIHAFHKRLILFKTFNRKQYRDTQYTLPVVVSVECVVEAVEGVGVAVVVSVVDTSRKALGRRPSTGVNMAQS